MRASGVAVGLIVLATLSLPAFRGRAAGHPPAARRGRGALAPALSLSASATQARSHQPLRLSGRLQGAPPGTVVERLRIALPIRTARPGRAPGPGSHRCVLGRPPTRCATRGIRGEHLGRRTRTCQPSFWCGFEIARCARAGPEGRPCADPDPHLSPAGSELERLHGALAGAQRQPAVRELNAHPTPQSLRHHAAHRARAPGGPLCLARLLLRARGPGAGRSHTAADLSGTGLLGRGMAPQRVPVAKPRGPGEPLPGRTDRTHRVRRGRQTRGVCRASTCTGRLCRPASSRRCCSWPTCAGSRPRASTTSTRPATRFCSR